MNKPKVKERSHIVTPSSSSGTDRQSEDNAPLLDKSGKPLSGKSQPSGEPQQLTDRAGDALSSGGTAISDCVQSSPVSTTLAVFGLGLGAGVLLGQLMAGPARSRNSVLEQTLGRSVMRSLNSYVPDALRNHLPG